MIASNVEETRQIPERKPMHVVFCEGKVPDSGHFPSRRSSQISNDAKYRPGLAVQA